MKDIIHCILSYFIRPYLRIPLSYIFDVRFGVRLQNCEQDAAWWGNHMTHHSLLLVDICRDASCRTRLVIWNHGPLARYVKLRVAFAHAPGMPGTFSPPPRVSDPDVHHGTCVTHLPWCMPWLLTSDFLWSLSQGGENVPGIRGACATRNFAYLVRGPLERVLNMSMGCERTVLR